MENVALLVYLESRETVDFLACQECQAKKAIE